MRFLLVALLCALSYAQTVKEYDILLQQLSSGEPLRSVLQYGRCLLNGGPSVNATGGYDVDSWSVHEGVIFIDASKLILDYQSKSGGYVYDFVRTSIFPNGTVTNLATDIPAPDPNSGPAKYSEIFTCSLSDGSVQFISSSSNLVAIHSYPELLDTLKLGSSVRVTIHAEKCSVSAGGPLQFSEMGFKLDTYEAFDDPEKFGPPQLAWGTNSISIGIDGKKWVQRQTTATFSSSGNVALSFADLDPATLNPLPAGETPPELLCVLSGGFSMHAIQPKYIDHAQILRMRSYIVGHFNNQAQHSQKGDNHPYAEHISDIANQKVINSPSGFFNDGRFFVLEESYYTPGGARPMIFLFEPDSRNGSVRLTSYTPDPRIPVDELRNNNTNLKLDFNEMTISKSFNPALYTYDADSNAFSIFSETKIQGGVFRFTETIASETLTVMENIIINGHSMPIFAIC